MFSILTVIFGVLTSMLVKELAQELSIIRILIFRFWFALPILILSAFLIHKKKLFFVNNKLAMALRVILGLSSITLVFLALQNISLGLATALFQSSIIFVTLASPVLLGEKIGVPKERDRRIFGKFENIEITTGASGDLKQAYTIAKEYITTYGFSEEFNVVHADDDPDLPFLGRDILNGNMGGGKDPIVEQEIAELIKYACKQAYDIIMSNEESFLKIIDLLGEKRTIDGDDVALILGIINK